MAHDVFISHSAHNREVADAVCDALEKTGIRCWVAPRDVRPGRSFPGEITRAIQQSKVMLLVFSSHSNNSEQVLREVQLATDSHLAIVRFRIEDVALTDDLRYFLSTPHWLDALTPPLSKHIARLQLAIKELIDQSVEVTGKSGMIDDAPVAAPPAPITVAPAPTFQTPSAVAPAMPPPLPVPAPSQKERETVTPKSFNPWPLLAIAAVVIFAAIIGVIFILIRQPKTSKQTSTTPSQSAPTSAAMTKRPSPVPTRVTQNPSPPAKAPKTTADTQHTSESDNVSAFERAGSLRHPTEPRAAQKREPTEEPKSAFDRVGGNAIGSDQSSAEPSPEDR